MYNREDLQNRVEMTISDIHKLNYTNFNDKYDVNRYVKAWTKLAKVKIK